MLSSWNIDANKPEKLTKEDDNEVRKWLGGMDNPDIIVVGIQEIVDLESKKQTARKFIYRISLRVFTSQHRLFVFQKESGRNRGSLDSPI